MAPLRFFKAFTKVAVIISHPPLGEERRRTRFSSRPFCNWKQICVNKVWLGISIWQEIFSPFGNKKEWCCQDVVAFFVARIVAFFVARMVAFFVARIVAFFVARM